MLPFTYHSNTSPDQCRLSIPPQVPSISPSVRGFLPPYFSNHLKLHKYALCPLVFPPYFFPNIPSSQLPAEIQYELSISQGVTPFSTTKAFSRPKHVCLLATILQPLADQLDGHKVGEPEKGTTLFTISTEIALNSASRTWTPYNVWLTHIKSIIITLVT